MLRHYLQTRGLSRLMSVLFAVQIVLGGFCLLTSQAHAMSQTASGQAVHAHCGMGADASEAASLDLSNAATAPLHQSSSDQVSNCYHCDQPDQLSGSTSISVDSLAVVVFESMDVLSAPQFNMIAAGLLSVRTPTGPPNSSSLLYTTSQRILI